MQVLGSILFSMMVILNTIVFGLVCCFLVFFPFHARAKYARPYAQFNVWLLKVLCGVRYEIFGRENIPESGSYIVFSNHQSTWDTFIAQLIFPPISFVVKKELLYMPIFGWVLAIFKPIAIKRSSGSIALKQLIAQGIARLKDNIIVMIYPEGTRIPPDTKAVFKKGGAILAEKSGYPVIPVALNAGYYWPKGGFFKKRGLITVHIGKPIVSEGRKAKDIMLDAESFITSHIEPARYE